MLIRASVVFFAILFSLGPGALLADSQTPPAFHPSQPELFLEPGALTNAWADFDGDGDLDLFVGFRIGHVNRMYRNDGGRFEDVAAEVGLNDVAESRAAAWGDYDGDGDLDLYVGFARGTTSKNRLYRNEGNGRHFTDVASTFGLDLVGTTRQVSWVDFDNDGDADLFIAFRDLPNILMRNDGGRFTDISKELGIDDPRRTVGTVWFDFDEDGDLDLFVANMDGTANALFRNEETRFVDRASELGLTSGGRPLGRAEYGSVRACVVDFDTDGHLDLFVANYGPNALYRNEGDGKFVNVAPEMGLAIDSRYDSCAWGDYDNDGRPDLYVNGTVSRLLNYRDYLFHNQGDFFVDVTSPIVLDQESDHGAQWADVDGDGDVDLAITGGNHYLLLNLLRPDRARRSIQVLVLDAKGHYTRAGAEVRIYGTRSGELLGTGIMDTGSGYNSQNAMPIHFGLSEDGPVDVEITTMTRAGRMLDRVKDVDPEALANHPLVVEVGPDGRLR